MQHNVWQVATPLPRRDPRSLHTNLYDQSKIPFEYLEYHPDAYVSFRNAENRFSPTSNFIDISGSFDASPTLPWDHKLPPSRDIYDIPEEEVSVHDKVLVGRTLIYTRNRQSHTDPQA